VLSGLRQQIASGAALKWKDFEFKGVDVSVFDRDGLSYAQEPADKAIFDQREKNYSDTKCLFLVHRAKPTGLFHSVNGLPTYDISVYLVPHKSFGQYNDVREVQYYFGRHFGLSLSEFGTKYVVKNGTDGFAAKINAYGPTLCEARVIFHDGTEATLSRYLDFEGLGYRFQHSTIEADVRKLESRLEDDAKAKLAAPTKLPEKVMS
jgi:hypothetical protein